MRKDIKTTNLTLTNAIRDYVDQKINHLDRLISSGDESVHAQVELDMTTHHHHKGKLFRAEINLRVAGKEFRAVETAENLYAAIDLVKDELARELKGYKNKRLDMFRRGGRLLKSILKFGRK